MLGGVYSFGERGIAQSLELAAYWRATSAASGIARSRSNLGWRYFHGKGIPQDKDKSLRLHRLAARQGFAESMFNLALSLGSGDGCDKDEVQAAQWMRRSAELGSGNGQGQLGGWHLMDGSPLPRNYKEAMCLSMLATEKGVAFAIGNVGLLFEKGLGVAKDTAEACKWYRRAAELGGEAAITNLRRLARDGNASAVAFVRKLRL